MREVEHEYLVSVVSQVDAEGAHAMEDKFHGGQEVIEHCRLPKSTGQVQPQDKRHYRAV